MTSLDTANILPFRIRRFAFPIEDINWFLFTTNLTNTINDASTIRSRIEFRKNCKWFRSQIMEKNPKVIFQLNHCFQWRYLCSLLWHVEAFLIDKGTWKYQEAPIVTFQNKLPLKNYRNLLNRQAIYLTALFEAPSSFWSSKGSNSNLKLTWLIKIIE